MNTGTHVEELALVEPDKKESGSLQRQVMNSNQGAIVVAVPRNIGSVIRHIDQLAELMGDKWKYRIPFGGEAIEGPTIGCAMAVARAWGNCDVSCDKIEETKDAWVFHASFVDLETGFRVVRPLRQRKSQKLSNKMDADRQKDIAFLIGASKAMRNVITNALRDVVDIAVAKAEKRVTDQVAENREAALNYVRGKLEEFEIAEERVSQFHGAKIDKLPSNKIAIIYKELQAIEDGIVDAADAFPVKSKPSAPIDVQAEGIQGTGETKPKADDGDHFAGIDGDDGPEKKTRKVQRFEFRGKGTTKTAFIRDMGQEIRACPNGSDLANLSDEFYKFVDTIDDADLADDLKDKVVPIFTRKSSEFEWTEEDEQPEMDLA